MNYREVKIMKEKFYKGYKKGTVKVVENTTTEEVFDFKGEKYQQNEKYFFYKIFFYFQIMLVLFQKQPFLLIKIRLDCSLFLYSQRTRSIPR